ncbi:MAG: hypothetical protein P1U56_25290 [Saprospiraceae bacterium]|nr:hypothetical protein [Saprospiraceae bacterium]
MRRHMKYLGVKPNSEGKTKWSAIRSSVKGHLSFIKLIEGKRSVRYKALRKKFQKASIVRKDFEFTIYI